MLFNGSPVGVGRMIAEPNSYQLKSTLGLWNCSVEDAIKYGGEVTRAALGAFDIQNDRKYVVVDTKIHMLMPGFMPALPGWHTDGVPRGSDCNPASKGLPDMWAQLDGGLRSSHYHLLVTGVGCLTEFIKDPLYLEVPQEPSADLYKSISHQVKEELEAGRAKKFPVPWATATTWDWWNLHTATVARNHEWRFLIRVTETDHFPPERDLRSVIRNQQQVYVPQEFGW